MMDDVTAAALVRLWLGREASGAECCAMIDQARRAREWVVPLTLPKGGDLFQVEPAHFDTLRLPEPTP